MLRGQILIPPDGHFNEKPWYKEFEKQEATNCECCGRLLKIYKRKLSRAMAFYLINIYKLHRQKPDTAYFHVRSVGAPSTGGDFAQLRYWGLIRERSNEKPEKKTSGMWRMTDFGARFVKREEQVPKQILLKWGSELLGFTGEMADIKTCLEYKNKFNYRELMEFDTHYQGQLELDGFGK